MASIYDVDPNALIAQVANELKGMIKAPEWAPFVKTGVHKERPPIQDDWWFIRAAAVLRTIERMGPIGTSKLRAKYGGKKNRGHKTEHFYKGSGSIIRKILQQLEKEGLVKQTEMGVHKGRIVTPKGQSILDKAAQSLPKAAAPRIRKYVASAEGSAAEKAEKRQATVAAAPKPASSKAPAGDKPKEAKPSKAPAKKGE